MSNFFRRARSNRPDDPQQPEQRPPVNPLEVAGQPVIAGSPAAQAQQPAAADGTERPTSQQTPTRPEPRTGDHDAATTEQFAPGQTRAADREPAATGTETHVGPSGHFDDPVAGGAPTTPKRALTPEAAAQFQQASVNQARHEAAAQHADPQQTSSDQPGTDAPATHPAAGPDAAADPGGNGRDGTPAEAPIVRGEPIGRIPITDVAPKVAEGAYPVKAVEFEEFKVRATIFREGHDAVGASVVLTDPLGETQHFDMEQVEPLGLDIFEAWVRVGQVGDWTYHIEAFDDAWHTWRHHAEAKLPARIDVDLVKAEAHELFGQALEKAQQVGDIDAMDLLEMLSDDQTTQLDPDAFLLETTSATVNEVMGQLGPRRLLTASQPVPVRVERRRALASAWYEFFPRSQGAHQDENGRWVSGTFAQSHERLAAAAAMGFDVVYMPPIHPIGTQFRKGSNNTLTPSADDPGSPWAIGNSAGGHDAIHPDLGTIEDFDALVTRAGELGLEVALDFALQASPDHPWLTEHPEWFTTRVDGTIAYAENPPKKYQDIYPINFDNDFEPLFAECVRVLEYWISHGVTIFRVDNPHTKPVAFWGRLLEQMHRDHPEVIFLAEAFTRPAMMKALGAVGFQLSYSYFTWRTSAAEIREYLEELAWDWSAQYRPSFWVNTPDINPFHLHGGNHAMFAIRAILAATLSPSWGMYSGYELYEHEPLGPEREEYLDSEKFAYRPRDYDVQPNLGELVTTLNHARRQNLALQQLRRIDFHTTTHPDVLAYSKMDGESRVLCLVSLNPDAVAEGEVTLDLEVLDMDPTSLFRVDDVLSDNSHIWGTTNYFRLTPEHPAHVFVVTPTWTNEYSF